MALPHLQRQFPGTAPNLGAGVTAPPSLPPLPLPQAPWHPPVCTAHHSKLECASLGLHQSLFSHTAHVALPRELSPDSCCSTGRESFQRGFGHQHFCFPMVLPPFQAPQALCAACLDSQAQRRLKENREETCGVSNHCSVHPK